MIIAGGLLPAERGGGGHLHVVREGDGQQEYAGPRQGGPPRLYTGGGAGGGCVGAPRPATADPRRRGEHAGEGVGGGGLLAASRHAVGRRRPGIPVVIQERLRQRENARLVPPSAAGMGPDRGGGGGGGVIDLAREEGSGGGGGRAVAIKLKPRTPCEVVKGWVGGGGGRGVGGAGPAFFPPNAPIPYSTNRARPTIEDLIRQEVEQLPDSIGADAGGDIIQPTNSAGRGFKTSRAEGDTSSSSGARKAAAQGHEDLLAWFREQVVEEEGVQGAEALGAGEIWEGRPVRSGAGGDKGEGRRVRGAVKATRENVFPAQQQTQDRDGGGEGGSKEEGVMVWNDLGHKSGGEEGVMVWGNGGRGRQGKNPLHLAVGEGGMVGRGNALVVAGVEETEDERRERLLAILKRRQLLLQKGAGGGGGAGYGSADESQKEHEETGGGGQNDETISGESENEDGEREKGEGQDTDTPDHYNRSSSGSGGSGRCLPLQQAQEVGWRLSSPAGHSGIQGGRGSGGRRGDLNGDHDASLTDGSDACEHGDEDFLPLGGEEEEEEEKEEGRGEGGREREKYGGDEDEEETRDEQDREGEREEEEGADDEGEVLEKEERQRGKLLEAAMQQARAGLVGSLGETRFASLYKAVMAVEASEADGGVGESWGSDRHGWQMLQYVYLEGETQRIREKYGRI